MTDVLPIRQEILIDGVWTDATPYVRGSSLANIRIQRGFTGEQSGESTSSCNLTLNNRDGRWSNRLPNSVNYGKVGRNVQVRTGLELPTPSLRLIDGSTLGGYDYDGASVFTTDKAVLDITGDIDIRWDGEADDWRGRAGHILCGKYTLDSDERSWVVMTNPFGYLILLWSTDGTLANRLQATSTVPVPARGRTALRVTLDVNNGAAGNTTTFYTSDTIGGSWTQLGATVVQSGTTSIYSSTATLHVGTANEAAGRYVTFGGTLSANPFCGKIYGFELRNGIAGTLVAQMDATAQTPGDTSFSDGLGTPNTWTLQTSAEISEMDWRFWGEMSSPSIQSDTTGTDVIVPVQAGDLRQRLSQGQPPLRSPIYRNMSRFDWDGYWTCEDGFDATGLAAEDGAQGGFTNANFGVATDLPGTAGALVFTDDSGFAYGNCTLGSTAGISTHMWYFKLAEVEASGVGETFMVGLYAGGNIARATVDANNASYTVNIYSTTGAVLESQAISFGAGAEPDQWIGMRLMLTQNGGNVDWALAWYPRGGATVYGSSGSFAATLGRPRGWNCPPFVGKFGMELAHVAMGRLDVDWESAALKLSTNAYAGESAYERCIRLAAEEDIPLFLRGLAFYNNVDLTPLMGVQGLLTVLELFQQCADVLGGLLYSPRGKYGIEIRFHNNLINRSGPELSRGDHVFSPGLTADEGDFGIRNDVTATRPSGTGQGRFTKTSGPMNTSDPSVDPQGIGIAPGTVSVNAYPDSRLDDYAAYAVHLGTWDEARWTGISWILQRANFTADPTLAADIRALDLGDRFDITDMPAWLPPDDAPQMLRGYTEILTNQVQTIDANAMPYTPYLVNDFTEGDESRFHIGDDGLSTLVAGIDADDTTFDVDTEMEGVGLWWLEGAPLANAIPIKIGGEVMNATTIGAPSVVGTAWRQAFTVTRNVNGIVGGKSHDAGALVETAEPFYLDL
jgi:hypothetical protein